jgi:hypothetical protein
VTPEGAVVFQVGEFLEQFLRFVSGESFFELVGGETKQLVELHRVLVGQWLGPLGWHV